MDNEMETGNHSLWVMGGGFPKNKKTFWESVKFGARHLGIYNGACHFESSFSIFLRSAPQVEFLYGILIFVWLSCFCTSGCSMALRISCSSSTKNRVNCRRGQQNEVIFQRNEMSLTVQAGRYACESLSQGVMGTSPWITSGRTCSEPSFSMSPHNTRSDPERSSKLKTPLPDSFTACAARASFFSSFFSSFTCDSFFTFTSTARANGNRGILFPRNQLQVLTPCFCPLQSGLVNLAYVPCGFHGLGIYRDM